MLNNIKIEDINFNFFDALKFKIKKSTLGLIIYQLIEDIKKIFVTIIKFNIFDRK